MEPFSSSLTDLVFSNGRFLVAIAIKGKSGKFDSFFFSRLSKFKADIKTACSNSFLYTWHTLDNGVKADVLFFLSIDDATAYLRKRSKSFTLPENLDSLNQNYYFFGVINEAVVPLQITFFMSLSPVQTVLSRVENYSSRFKPTKVLQKSFSHSLSTAGQTASDRLKTNILIRFRELNTNESEDFAPVASWSQGSGSGKSKLSVELITDGHGFYIVLRNEGSTGYPENNDLLQEFIMPTRSPDSLVNMTNFDYRNCNTAKILFLLASIVTVYLRYWYTLVADCIDKLKADPEITCNSDLYQDAAPSACAELGKLFDFNSNIDCNVFKSDEVKNRILTAAEQTFGFLKKVKLPTVYRLAEYIKNILANPYNAFDNKSQINSDAISTMKAFFGSFSFYFYF